MPASDTMIAGRYRLEERVASGGMGVVWRAWDERLERTVAVKQLRTQAAASDEEAELAKNRAMREARITARLRHPNAVPVFDAVEHDGQPCLIMPFLPSRPLSAVLREHGAFSPAEAAGIGAQVASALAAAHRIGIVHRDVKPGNVLIADEDGSAHISDFGISHALGDSTLTATGLVHGTPAYLAPEVARGSESTFSSDVFSLGSTLYAMTEGQPPFGADNNSIAMLHRVALADFPPARHSGVLRSLLGEMMSLDPALRPSMATAATRLAALHAAARQAYPGTVTQPLARSGIAAGEEAAPGRPNQADAPAAADAASAAPAVATAGAAVAGAAAASAVVPPQVAPGVDAGGHVVGPEVRDEGLTTTVLGATRQHQPTALLTHAAGPTREQAPAAPAALQEDPSPAGPSVLEEERPHADPPGSGPAGPGSGEPRPEGPRRRRRGPLLVLLALLLAAAAIIAGVIGALGAPAHPTKSSRSPAARPTTVHSSSAPTRPSTTPSPTTTASPSPSPSPSPRPQVTASTSSPASTAAAPPARTAPRSTTPVQALYDYYALLPENTDAAWPQLTEDYQVNTAKGRSGFDGFWGQMSGVSLSEVQSTGPNRVVALVTYREKDGTMLQERTAYRFVQEGGGLKIAESERVG